MGVLLREVIPMVGGKGGGKPDFAQGGGTDPTKVRDCLDAAKRFFTEWKDQRKQLEAANARLAELETKAAGDKAQTVNGIRLVSNVLPGAVLQKTATELVAQPKTVALLGSTDGSVRIVFARSADVQADMGVLLRDVIGIVGGKGGGKPDFAQGGGQDPSKVKECLDAAKHVLEKLLA